MKRLLDLGAGHVGCMNSLASSLEQTLGAPPKAIVDRAFRRGFVSSFALQAAKMRPLVEKMRALGLIGLAPPVPPAPKPVLPPEELAVKLQKMRASWRRYVAKHLAAGLTVRGTKRKNKRRVCGHV